MAKLIDCDMVYFLNCIKNKRIIAFGVRKKFNKFVSDYSLMDKIEFVVDNDKKKQGGYVEVRERLFVVRSADALMDLCWDNTIIMITSMCDFLPIIEQINGLHDLERNVVFYSYLLLDQGKKEKIEYPEGYRHIPKIIHCCWFGRNRCQCIDGRTLYPVEVLNPYGVLRINDMTSMNRHAIRNAAQRLNTKEGDLLNSQKDKASFRETILSIIVTVYRVSSYLEKCLDSILAQTFESFEVILVDDGSDDGSEKICDQYAKLDSRIRVIHKRNGGLTSARISGVNLAKGMYISFVDGDDWLDLDGYREIIKILLKTQVDIVSFGLKKEYEGFTTSFKDGLQDGIYSASSLREAIKKFMDLAEWSHLPIVTSLSTVAVKRDLFLTAENLISDKGISSGEDTLRVSLMIFMARRIYVFSSCPYHYLIRENSMIRTENAYDLQNAVRMISELVKSLRIMKVFGPTEREYAIRLAYRSLAYMACEKFLEGTGVRCFPQVKKDSHIIIYGKGRFGKGIYRYLTKIEFCKVVTIVDRNDIDRLNDIPFYDYILIGLVVYYDIVDAKQRLIEYGIPEKKICCVEKNALKMEYLPEELQECFRM